MGSRVCEIQRLHHQTLHNLDTQTDELNVHFFVFKPVWIWSLSKHLLMYTTVDGMTFLIVFILLNFGYMVKLVSYETKS